MSERAETAAAATRLTDEQVAHLRAAMENERASWRAYCDGGTAGQYVRWSDDRDRLDKAMGGWADKLAAEYLALRDAADADEDADGGGGGIVRPPPGKTLENVTILARYADADSAEALASEYERDGYQEVGRFAEEPTDLVVVEFTRLRPSRTGELTKGQAG